jgi:O-antigen ligase
VSSNRSASSRRAVEQRSAAVLIYLRQLPRWLPPVVLAALLVAGLAVRGPVGAAALCVVAAFLAWLGYLSWPRLAGPGRLGRVAAVALLLGLAALQVTS